MAAMEPDYVRSTDVIPLWPNRGSALDARVQTRRRWI